MNALPATTALLVALTGCASRTATTPKEMILPFDLVCTAADKATLTFHIARADDGDAFVETMNGQPLTDYETHTYVNAFMWTNGTNRYTADRFTGQLTVRPQNETYQCERRGGRRF
jgi:hypothetical protein